MSLRRIFAAAAIAVAGLVAAYAPAPATAAPQCLAPAASMSVVDQQMQKQGMTLYAAGREGGEARMAFLLYRSEPVKDKAGAERPAPAWVLMRMGETVKPGAPPMLQVCEVVKGRDLTRVFDRYPLGVLAALPAQQQGASPAVPRDKVIEKLATDYNEHRVAYGISADGRMLIEIFDVPDNARDVRAGKKDDSFTILLTDAATGKTSLVGAGRSLTFVGKDGKPVPNTGFRPPAV